MGVGGGEQMLCLKKNCFGNNLDLKIFVGSENYYWSRREGDYILPLLSPSRNLRRARISAKLNLQDGLSVEEA